jgi:hypothetical protein
MKSGILRMTALCAACCLVALPAIGQPAEARGAPQSPPNLDPEQHHQGSKLAAYLSGRGWRVRELPQGMADMGAELENADLAIRIGDSRPHTQGEVEAYKEFVRQGRRLLIMAGPRSDLRPDPLADAFGLRFENAVSEALIDRWAAHPAARELPPLPFRVGCVVTECPDSATPLAWLSAEPSSPTSGALVIGALPFGEGTVVFLSNQLLLLRVPQPFTDKLFSFLSPS